MPKTKYTGVYSDANGKFFYQTELGVDKATGERIQCKSRKDQLGQPFATAYAAHKELIRVKHAPFDQLEGNSFVDYRRQILATSANSEYYIA